jgi:hypothetical protein
MGQHTKNSITNYYRISGALVFLMFFKIVLDGFYIVLSMICVENAPRILKEIRENMKVRAF